MNPTFFHILLSMVDGERHGYALIKEIADRTGGRIRLGPGSLYWSLNRLREAGMIEEKEARPDPGQGDERRRYYRITESGSKLLAAEAESWAGIVALAVSKGVIHAPESV